MNFYTSSKISENLPGNALHFALYMQNVSEIIDRALDFINKAIIDLGCLEKISFRFSGKILLVLFFNMQISKLRFVLEDPAVVGQRNGPMSFRGRNARFTWVND